MKLFQENLIKNLPDCYNKEPTSNNYKIMQLIQHDSLNFKAVLNEITESLDLDKVIGRTLDLYGEMVGQKRGMATDEQYRLMIKTKIARNRCTGNHRTVVDCLCRILNCEPSQIKLEDSEKPATVKLSEIPLETIVGADLTPSQFTQLIKSLLAAGVNLESSLYSGTFMFSDIENEASTTEGFCQNDGDDYGGYLGALSGEKGIVLPI